MQDEETRLALEALSYKDPQMYLRIVTGKVEAEFVANGCFWEAKGWGLYHVISPTYDVVYTALPTQRYRVHTPAWVFRIDDGGDPWRGNKICKRCGIMFFNGHTCVPRREIG